MSEKWERCTRCVISSDFPRITFDDEGVCSFCRDRAFYAAEANTIEQARNQVEQLFVNRTRGGRYDALLCLSGGKDSSYTLMLAVKKYGLRILAFTFDNGYLSERTVQNIKCMVDAMSVDLITIRPASDVMKSIIRTSVLHPVYSPRTLTRISAVCNSCITMVNTSAESIALEKDIPFIISGFTLGQIPSNALVYRPNYQFIMESRRKAVETLVAHAGSAAAEYFSIGKGLLQRSFPWHINLLCLESIVEDEIIEKLQALGWRQPKDVDGCSSNCRLNAFNNLAHELAYGYNPYELELSHLVRKGLLSRAKALEKLADKADSQVGSILEELQIKREDLESAAVRLGNEAARRIQRKKDD